MENNASFTMNGGTISNNKGINGAGVCVVDDNLQKGQTEYNTTFIMEGGTIKSSRLKNTGVESGGGDDLFLFQWSNII